MKATLIRVKSTLYKQADSRVQNIMQNISDAMDYSIIPNTEIHLLGMVILGFIEQPEVESVNFVKLGLESGGYQFTIRYKGYDTARTEITFYFNDEYECEERTIFDMILADLSKARLLEVIGVTHPEAEKEKVKEDKHGTAKE